MSGTTIINVVLPDGHKNQVGVRNGEHVELDVEGRVMFRLSRLSHGEFRLEIWPDPLEEKPKRERRQLHLVQAWEPE